MGLLDRFKKNTAKRVQEELDFARKLNKDGLTREAYVGFEKVCESPAATPRQKEQALRYLLLGRGVVWRDMDGLRFMVKEVAGLRSPDFFTQIDQEFDALLSFGLAKTKGGDAELKAMLEQGVREGNCFAFLYMLYLPYPWSGYEGFEALYDGRTPSYDDYVRRAAYGGCYEAAIRLRDEALSLNQGRETEAYREYAELAERIRSGSFSPKEGMEKLQEEAAAAREAREAEKRKQEQEVAELYEELKKTIAALLAVRDQENLEKLCSSYNEINNRKLIFVPEQNALLIKAATLIADTELAFAKKLKYDDRRAHIVRGLSWYNEAAKKGGRAAQKKMAIVYRDGSYGWERDLEKAYEYFCSSAEDGDSYSQLYAGLILLLTNAGGNDNRGRRAFAYLEQAAKNGQVRAVFYCARMLEEGDGIPKDKTGAARYKKMLEGRGLSMELMEAKEQLLSAESALQYDIERVQFVDEDDQEIFVPLF